jgi:hypothetical protein
MERPPSPTWWLLDGLTNGGHTVGETLAYASWQADYEDEQTAVRALPMAVISPERDTWWRRLVGRRAGR